MELCFSFSFTHVAKTSKPSNGPQKENSANTAKTSLTFADPEKFVEEILEKTSASVLSQVSSVCY